MYSVPIIVVLNIGLATMPQHNRYQLRLTLFYPEGQVQLARKQMPNMPVGVLDPSSPAQATRDLMESFPVEKRLRMIDRFLDYLPGYDYLDKERMDPYDYLLHNSVYMDPGILRLLIRFATRSPPLAAVGPIQSASELVNYVQAKFPDGTFDYITPEYILDWYAAMKDPKFLVRGNPFVHRRPPLNAASFDETTIFSDDPHMAVDLAYLSRLHILILRRDRLLTTGYEIA